MNEWVIILGYALIAFSWIFQVKAMKNSKGISPLFVVCYILGFSMVIYDQYMMGITNLALINIANVLLPFLVLWKLKKGTSSPENKKSTTSRRKKK